MEQDSDEHRKHHRHAIMRTTLENYKKTYLTRDVVAKYLNPPRDWHKSAYGVIDYFERYDAASETNIQKLEAVYMMAEMVRLILYEGASNHLITRALDNISLALDGYITTDRSVAITCEYPNLKAETA